MDKGRTYKQTSKDLTKGGKKGDVAYGTLTSIHESPLRFGLIYAGSDDGLIHISKDMGNTWTDITGKLPADMWVSRIRASAHDEATVYCSLNGYRWDDFSAMVYRSTDYGNTWEAIGKDLPAEPVNVIKEDPENADILYVGTDNGLYISLNRGQSFSLLDNGLPATPVHDLVIHKRDHDLVVGTHGRSIYIANVEHLQQLDDSIRSKPAHIFAIDDRTHRKNWGNAWSKWVDLREPELKVGYWHAKGGKVTAEVRFNDIVLKTLDLEPGTGLNYLTYNLDLDESAKDAFLAAMDEAAEDDATPAKLKKADNDKYYLLPGTYTLRLKVSDAENVDKEFTITPPQD